MKKLVTRLSWFLVTLAIPFALGYFIKYIGIPVFHWDARLIVLAYGDVDSDLGGAFMALQGLMAIFGIMALCGVFEDSDDTGHDCNICGDDIQKGTGQHWPGYGSSGGCFCVCEKDKLTVKEPRRK